MTTRFDIGEKVYLEVQVDRVSISENGIFYDIRLPEGDRIRVAENKMYKTPANDVYLKEAHKQ